MNQESPKFEKGDVVIVEPNEGFRNQDHFAGVVLELLEERAGEEKVETPDGDIQPLAEFHSSDPEELLYSVQHLRIIDGEAVPGESVYTIRESKLKLSEAASQ